MKIVNRIVILVLFFCTVVTLNLPADERTSDKGKYRVTDEVPGGRQAIAKGDLVDFKESASIPGIMNYQGLLTENGEPSQGNKSMVFRLFESEFGGAALGRRHSPLP